MGSQRTVRAIAVSLVITAVTAAAVLFLGFDRHAAGDGGAQVSYNTVDMRAQMLKNGDLRVTQTFDYRLRPCGTPWRQMFQQYTLSSDRVTNISDISIKDLTTGRVYTQDTTVHSPGGYGDYGWNSECAGRWYIADITRSQTAPEPYDAELDALTPNAVGEPKQTKDVEIGWNIPSTASANSMRFELSMTWHGVSTAYDDVVALEWEPFSALNATPAARVTGTFTFPEGIGESNSWAWLHTGAASETTRGADGSLRFTVTDLPGGEYINVVVMTERRSDSAVARTQAGAMKRRILNQEQWEAQIADDDRRRRARGRIVMWSIPAALALILAVAALIGAQRACAQARKGTEGFVYWREPPDMSPAAAAALITDVVPGVQGAVGDRQMTSTLLSLATRGGGGRLSRVRRRLPRHRPEPGGLRVGRAAHRERSTQGGGRRGHVHARDHAACLHRPRGAAAVPVGERAARRAAARIRAGGPAGVRLQPDAGRPQGLAPRLCVVARVRRRVQRGIPGPARHRPGGCGRAQGLACWPWSSRRSPRSSTRAYTGRLRSRLSSRCRCCSLPRSRCR